VPPGTPIDTTSPPPPLASPLAYSPQEQEYQALLALHKAINGELSGLHDFRRFQCVGADALDNLKRHFEIKSFARAMPPNVKLTANEFERALKEGSKYYLVVVAGLEEGYETVVRIIADPVNTLAPQAATTVVLGGIANVKRPIEVRFGSATPE
jgi:Protein NO VEIN, C-terminal